MFVSGCGPLKYGLIYDTCYNKVHTLDPGSIIPVQWTLFLLSMKIEQSAFFAPTVHSLNVQVAITT